MKLYELTVRDFVSKVDSNQATPGGGSVSGLLSVLGLSLARMVGHLTVSKKKFLQLDESIKQEFNDALLYLLDLKEKIIPLIDKDSESFNEIMKAFKLPKDSKEEKTIRKAKIKEGTIEAIKIPYEIAKLSYSALDKLFIILKYGNKFALSDLGVSLLALSSGIEGAVYNVLINLIGFEDEKLLHFYKSEVRSLLEDTKIIKEKIYKEVYKGLEY